MSSIFPILKRKTARNLILVFLGLSSFHPKILYSAPFFQFPNSNSVNIKDSPKELIDQVWQIIYRDFLDASGNYNSVKWIDIRKEILSRKYVDRTQSYNAINDMLARLDDPYTRFLDPKQFKEMRIDTSGQLSGVGIQLSVDDETSKLIVVSPIEGTPAFKAGVLPKDVITEIDDKSTKDMSIETAVKLIRGKEGTSVTLGLERNGAKVKVELIRAKIEITSLNSHLNITQSGFKVGYIRLRQFSANASREMRNAINILQSKGAEGYVLDLRSNPGGLLEASVDIARQWLNKGTIVSTLTKTGIQDVRKANGSALTERPIIILVNEGSASASEILSGAIQDNKRGLLVGKKTFGKGLVQSVRALSDGSGLTVTIARYLTPLGRDIHKHGIKPDVEVGLSTKELETLTVDQLGTNKDPQYRIAENLLVKRIIENNTGLTLNSANSNFVYTLN
ncbi:S41 family peptidase [Prochlorococcus sp. MIT 1341]|uniref:S41 family peptidase n=1 Tax=Prochlorococcus sp. MIT 1341 TaxID=3096221 RepID=UPI002A756078|nr:S41 family peptidase [Prochlorococcus sp. MIT 1341]